MDKTEFFDILLKEGYFMEKDAQYPTVVCLPKEVKKVMRNVRDIIKEHGYSSSFGIRAYREGMSVVTKEGDVSFDPKMCVLGKMDGITSELNMDLDEDRLSAEPLADDMGDVAPLENRDEKNVLSHQTEPLSFKNASIFDVLGSLGA